MKDLDRINITIHIIENYSVHTGEEAIVRDLLHTTTTNLSKRGAHSASAAT